VLAPGFDGSCENLADPILGAPQCDVEVYSSGLRNMYDFVFHSNGSIYGPDNGLGVTGAFPPTPFPPCHGIGSSEKVENGGQNPGPQNDLLHRLLLGKYYGHPNPSRDECVFKDGTMQGVAPLPNWEPPFIDLGRSNSANGIIEYDSDSVCDSLIGDLVMANFSGPDDLSRVTLAPDGLSATGLTTLATGFVDPLPLALRNGVIYVGEFGQDQITSLTPILIGCWDQSPAAAPLEVLDVAGASVGNEVYMIGGKTSSGAMNSLYIYDIITDSWSQGPDMPSLGVENPAVTVLNGKVYAFGGSGSPFGGARTTASAYDPGSNTWQALAPMPLGVGGPTAAALDGKIYVSGGMDVTGMSVDALQIYDPVTDSWTTGASMLERRDNPGSGSHDGKLYVFGGRTRNADGTTVNGTLATAEMYDPLTNTWVPRANMPTGRRTFSTGHLNGRFQVIGGERTPSGGAFGVNEEYDPETDTWRQLAVIPTPRHGGTGATTEDGFIHVVGGGTTGGSSFSSIHEIFAF
jgi:N-acetylneuraminic acid mutarotase